MLGLTARLKWTPQIPTPSSPIPLFTIKRTQLSFSSPAPKPNRRLVAFAEKNNGESRKEVEGEGSEGGDSPAEEGKGRWRLPEGIRWSDLVVSGDPDNIVAVGLTGVLTWASVQVLWQLAFISVAILVAAVKYSFIAALLIFILITLL